MAHSIEDQDFVEQLDLHSVASGQRVEHHRIKDTRRDDRICIGGVLDPEPVVDVDAFESIRCAPATERPEPLAVLTGSERTRTAVASASSCGASASPTRSDPVDYSATVAFEVVAPAA